MKLFSRHQKSGGEKIILFKKSAFDQGQLHPDLKKLLEGYGATRIEPLPFINGAICYFSSDMQFQALDSEEEIASLEENHRVKLYPVKTSVRGMMFEQERHQIIPWGIHRIGADALWGLSRGEGIKVAVLDTGADLHHPDLQDNIAGGINLLDPHLPPQDDNGHGSHVSGTIAAVNNGFGVVGAAPRARLYVVKVLDYRGEGYFADIIRALQWCLNQGIQIVNISFGSDQPSQALHQSIRQVTAAGMIVVAAAGNDGTYQSVDYPAVYPEVVAVGATDEHNRLAPYSSRGPQLKMVAPGNHILSTGTGGFFQRMSGTSMATPHVSGALALLMALTPRLKPDQILRVLYKTAEKLPSLSDEEQGAGLVRVDLAAKAFHNHLEVNGEKTTELPPEEEKKSPLSPGPFPWPFPFSPPPPEERKK
ncbi:MAG: S8 family peptidase [Thermoanaerobacteraceae bacterium]|nr:S8 family peptidase [Thermoanaerobacteraceae bacterium]